MSNILSIQKVSMQFGGLVAVQNVSFDVHAGSITAVIGPNGAGKTTLFNCITGFYKPTSGQILAQHEGGNFILNTLAEFEICKTAKVARTFQNIRLFSGMTCLENLLVAQHNALMRASGFSLKGLLRLPSYQHAERTAMDTARYWLEQVGLLAHADDAAGSLPYGAQRRLEIARAMCTAPKLLCLDEPAAGLNATESAELNILLRHIRAQHGITIVLIEHDMSVVMEISDHIAVLEYGQLIAQGTPAEIRANPRVIAAYLGVDEVQT